MSYHNRLQDGFRQWKDDEPPVRKEDLSIKERELGDYTEWYVRQIRKLEGE